MVSKTVMVTGATGYVAGWLVKKLLDEAYTVHATVRDPGDKQKLQYLDALAEKAPGSIRYFKADLLKKDGFKEAMQGCEIVFHTASPFINKVDDPQKDLIDPALIGTRNVLETVDEVPSVKRVVLTSSCAAIIGDARDVLKMPGQIATEANWNETSSLEHQPYSYSKTLAEREAWKLNKGKSWKLVTINPSLVIGPGINPKGTSESFKIVKQLVDGSMKAGVPALEFGMVDVRDVAEAHYRAAITEGAEGRYIISAEHHLFLELADMLRPRFGDSLKLPKRKLPKWLVWLVAPAAGLQRSMISRNIGYPWRVDNSKGKKELGMHYRPTSESIVEFVEQIKETL
ncbi:MAG: aldehyde reductase [Bacteroidetes bacterium]|jgi:nucleoside-diphosphate-sugar epimerase|nr:aldehyde reductase [Bacteroidota bacterium]